MKLASGSGKPIRLRGDGTFASPFLWQAGTGVPAANLVSKTGMDAFVETDCVAQGGCVGGSHPRLMLYDEGCESGWFDSVQQACRP